MSGLVYRNGIWVPYAAAGTYQATPPTLADGDTSPLLLDSTGKLQIADTAVRDRLPATLGQKTMANSLGVAIASDQTKVPTDRKFAQTAAVSYRVDVQNADVLSAPTVNTLSSGTGGSLTSVPHGVSVVGMNDYGSSERSAVQTITPAASGTITIPITVGSFTRFRIFLSTSTTDPFFLAEVTTAQVTAGDTVTSAASGSGGGNSSTLATFSGSGTPGTITANVTGSGAARTSSSYQQSSAYIFSGSFVSGAWINCAGYECIDFDIVGSRNGDFFPLNATFAVFGQSSDSFGYLLTTFPFTPGSDVAGNVNSTRQRRRIYIRGHAAIALLIPVLQGTGARFSVRYSLN